MTQGEGFTFRTLSDSLIGPRFRGRRVAVLLMAVAVLSLADLYMTLVHLLSFGMLEANPIARLVMAHGSPAALIIWKLVTVGFALGVLYWARKRGTAEVAAVFACLVMGWLTLRWATYNNNVGELTKDLHIACPTREPHWVTMAPGG